MVSFQTALGEASSKKRKWEEPLAEEFFKDQTKGEKKKSIFDMELHLDTPLPSDNCQPSLSIQSGQIHLWNTMMNRQAPEDPKRIPKPLSPGHMSLDLGLNLTCESLRKKEDSYDINEKQGSLSEHDHVISKYRKLGSDGLTRSPSWLSSEAPGDHKEMVATVCMRCHMLVMLCQSSPACPNCKFMHPPDQNPSTFLKRKCTLLC